MISNTSGGYGITKIKKALLSLQSCVVTQNFEKGLGQ